MIGVTTCDIEQVHCTVLRIAQGFEGVGLALIFAVILLFCIAVGELRKGARK